MNNHNTNIWTKLVLPCFFILLCSACSKDFLDKKPDQKLLVPTTLADFQSLLDNTVIMNVSPTLAGIATDDLYTTSAGLTAYGLIEGNSYTWAPDLLQGRGIPEWTQPYQAIFYANVVLEGLEKLKAGEAESVEARQIRGAALFFRAYCFYQLAQVFAKPYHAATAGSDPGIPTPLSPDVNQRSGRGTVQQIYSRMLTDLTEAAVLLPVQVTFKTRPSKAAAYAMRSRVYLLMGDYVQSEAMATEVLKLNDKLLNYNSLTLTLARPLPNPLTIGNPEVIFHSTSYLYTYELSALTYADTLLYRSYQSGDLRKQAFFRVTNGDIVGFKGNYTGTSTIFTGLCNDEVYLSRAECRARRGDTEGAMEDLNVLLKNRWNPASWSPLSSADAKSALRLVLTERRKELLTRGTRWPDLRRLNKDPDFAVTLLRKINNQVYTLAPNDPRYVFPIPDNEISLNAMEQNIRE